MPSTDTVIPHSKPWITDEDNQSVNTVLKSNMIAQGNLTEQFEQSICSYLNINSGVATSSGTAALILAFRVLKITKGAEIILPSYVCRSVLDAIVSVGAIPVLCDIGEQWVMTTKEIAHHISSKTAAIIAVHIFGLPVDIKSLRIFNVFIIEDACQAFGLNIDGYMAGSLGDIGILSFHATKCLTTGEGGMLVSNNTQFIHDAKCIKSYFPVLLSDMQAALGLSQLSRYSMFIERRRLIKLKYTETLQHLSFLELPDNNIDFTFRFSFRDHSNISDLKEKMLKKNICIRKGVDRLLHRESGLSDNDFPNTVSTYEQTVSIPYYPALSDSESDEVLNALKGVYC